MKKYWISLIVLFLVTVGVSISSLTFGSGQTPISTGGSSSGGGLSAAITSINGNTTAAQLITSGSAGTDVAVSSSGGTTTVNVPDAGASARGAVTTGTQTLAGVKTLSSKTIMTQIQIGGTANGADVPIKIVDTSTGVSNQISSDVYNEFILESFSNSVAFSPFFISTRGRGTKASPIAISNNDPIFAFIGYGQYDTTVGHRDLGGEFYLKAAEDFTGSARGTYWQFKTVTVGATTSVERMKIQNSGATFTTVDVILATAGKGLQVTEGANACMGVATCNATTEVTITTTCANNRIFLSYDCTGVGAPTGPVYQTALTGGTSFGFKCGATDTTSKVNWSVVKAL